ncbi:MAG: hypothetical protein ACFFER_17150, partial [Candidatus Thorarchaeota archaeon]
GFSENDRSYVEMIRAISPPHCARGPNRCDACAEAAKTKVICLVRVYLDPGQFARPIMELSRDGDTSYYEFDVVRQFETEAEAMEYARNKGIRDVQIQISMNSHPAKVI